MGLRSVPYIAQRITNAIAFIHRQMEYFLLNYVDDFIRAEVQQRAWQAFQALTLLLEKLNVETSKDKIVPPTTRLEFLGITFDSENMTMEISPEKVKEIQQEIDRWLQDHSKAKRTGFTNRKTTVCSQMHQKWQNIPGEITTMD